MKELSIEEKAKAYDEALSVAQETYATQPMYRDWLAKMFPELKESESEYDKIRKRLIEFFKDWGKTRSHCWSIYIPDILAWLEKQGEQNHANSTKTCKGEQKTVEWHREDEQNLNTCLSYIPDEYLRRWLVDVVHVKYDKPADKVEPKFKVGDTIKCKYDDRQFTIKSVNLDKGTYTYTQEGCGNDIDYADEEFELVEQKPVEEYNITGIGSKNAQGKLGEMIKNLKPINEVLEQNHTDKVEPKFKVGDWVIFNEHHNSVYQVEKIDNYRYYLRHYLGGTLSIRFDSELIRKWTLQDAKSGDVLVDKYNNIGIYKEIEGIYWDSYIYLGCDGKLYDFRVGGMHDQTNPHPATKGQRDNLLKAMAEAGWDFDFDKKELKKIKPIDEYEGLTDFERAVADACIGFIDKDLVGWKQYVKDSADDLLKIAVKKFHAVQDDTTIAINNEEAYKIGFSDGEAHAKEEMTSTWSEEDAEMVEGLNNCLDELEEKNGWKYVYVKDKNVELTEVRNWLKSIKDRVGCEANRTTTKQRSEDEESIINKAESWLDTLCDYLKDSSPEYISDIKDVINKLKSLKDRIGG